MTPDALRDALIASVASAVLFFMVQAVRRRVPGAREEHGSMADVGTVAVVVFLVVLVLPAWRIGRDEVLPPPFAG